MQANAAAASRQYRQASDLQDALQRRSRSAPAARSMVAVDDRPGWDGK